MPGPSALRIELTDVERVELEGRTRRRKTARADALQAEIVLSVANGMTNLGIAQRLGFTRVTVTTWRKRFAAFRLDGLGDQPRPGAPRKIGDEKITELVTATLETLPATATPCSTRSMPSAGRPSATPKEPFGQLRQGIWCVGVDRALHLADIFAAAAPQRDIQIIH